ncbi:hypothetical protein Pint_32986 [Pistacia integerrima]|uniref:Uncharacterized protein n=1 Tax=Pistacia integerrima TaxID=434235 RepID=A0ACC0X3C2_9ROSI|nr:hypothetical protein Pint_32986 [Pistacia integerrima]
MFSMINTINYVDRGAIASNGVNGSLRMCDDKGICTSGNIGNPILKACLVLINPCITFIPYGKFSSKLNFKATGRGYFNLNNFQDGVLSSAFTVRLLVASPIFASLAKR